MNEADIAWMAGLLEGEGSFMFAKNTVKGRTYRYPRIVINMTDRDVIERVAALWETTVYDMPRYVPGNKPQYKATISGSRAVEWMNLILPYMGHRRSARIREVQAARKKDIEDLGTAQERQRSWSSEASRDRKRLVDGRFS